MGQAHARRHIKNAGGISDGSRWSRAKHETTGREIAKEIRLRQESRMKYQAA
jgi:hypothetical protein